MALRTPPPLIAALLVALMPAALAAQAAADDVPPAANEPGASQPRLFDRTLALIGDRAVLESSIRSELRAREEAWTGPVTPEQRTQWQNEIVGEIYREETLQQSAKTLPGTTQERIDRVFQEYMRDFKQQQVEKWGSVNSLTRKLGIAGTTWESVQEEQRARFMSQVAEQNAIQARFRDQFALMVTPKEMLRFYNEHLDEFVQPPSADLAVLAFPVGHDPQATLAQAKEAAAAWRETGGDGSAIRDRYDGSILLQPRKGVRDVPGDDNAAPIKAFAAKATEGEVSDPIPINGYLWLLRVSHRNPGLDASFDDAEVQSKIQLFLVKEKLDKVRERLILQSQQTFQLVRTQPH